MTAPKDVPISSWSPPTSESEPADRPVLWAQGSIVVRESTWAGSYYCAHLFHVVSTAARAPMTTIVKDVDGDPMVGFLHVPADGQALHESQPATAANRRPARERHQATRDVVAGALGGIIEQLEQRVPKGPLRVLLTGFGAFPGIVDNPTGDFVRNIDLVVEAVQQAFPGARRAHPTLPPLLAGGITLLRDGMKLPSQRELHIGACALPVDDDALAPDKPGSIRWAYDRFRPHAHVAMGVHRGQDYRVEVSADSAGLVVEDGVPRHQQGAPPVDKHPRNGALARAIARGVQRNLTS